MGAGSRELRASSFPPPPCGEGPGVGVAPDEAKQATLPDAQRRRSFLNHPHPYPPHKGEGADTPRLVLEGVSA